jgi:hypothetical protein
MRRELLWEDEFIIVRLPKNINVCVNKYSDAVKADFFTKPMEDHEAMA